MMKTDLSNRKDIEKLVNSFYDKVKSDELIGFIFNEVAKVNWDHHLPIMYGFWEMMLFGTGQYRGDPMTKHIELDKKTELIEIHFDRWRKLFTETVDELFTGSKADETKQRANHIASVMLFRIQQTRS